VAGATSPGRVQPYQNPSSGRRFRGLPQRLAEKQLSEADYQSFKRFIPSIDADKAAIAEFARSLNLAQDGLVETLKAVEGLDRPHLAMLAAAFTDAQRMATEATEQRVRAEKNLESLENTSARNRPGTEASRCNRATTCGKLRGTCSRSLRADGCAVDRNRRGAAALPVK
jgi:hypothetical protein